MTDTPNMQEAFDHVVPFIQTAEASPLNRGDVERMVAINRNRWSQSAGAPRLTERMNKNESLAAYCGAMSRSVLPAN
jgi:hypothetical protein